MSKVRTLGRSEAVLPWAPMLVGVAIMAGYVIYALMLRAGYQPEEPDGSEMVVPRPPIATSATPDPATPEPTVEPTERVEPPERDDETPSEPPPTTTPPPEPPPALVGEYSIDDTFDDVFIGKVTIDNGSNRAQDWTVELAFPDNVGNLNTFWVDGTPQPILREEGDLYIFTSTVPVEGRSQVILKFHFDRSGADVPPSTCTVNSTACVAS